MNLNNIDLKFFRNLLSKSLGALGLLVSFDLHALSNPVELLPIPFIPEDQGWVCPFPKPNGAHDWENFSPFGPLPLRQAFSIYDFRWDNERPEGPGWYGVPTRDIDHYGMGNKAVLQSLYVASLNSGYAAGGAAGLYPKLDPALRNSVKMGDLIAAVRKNTGILDGGYGTPEQLANGINKSISFFLYCANNYLGPQSKQIYYSSNWMPSMDINAFNELLINGTVMILQTNKLTMDNNLGGWVRSNTQETYLIKTIKKSNLFRDYGLKTYTLYNVENGQTKVVQMRNGKMRYRLSSGNLSKIRNMTLVDDDNPDYLEVIIGYAGIDPLVNRY